METKKINDRFSFVNEWKSTRNGFSHKSTLIEGTTHQWHETCQYLNRTWESYSFRTSMKKCVSCFIDYEHKELIEEFKRKFNKNTTTKAEKDALYSGSERIKQLTELLNLL
jgi:hypothetical protein